MGVPGLFKFICQRYPCSVGEASQPQMLEFDNLYLDMNGIFHLCSSQKNDKDLNFKSTEERIFTKIFHYVEALFSVIKPRKLLFFALDGPTPQAKMKNQRGRRFMSAKEKLTKAKNSGKEVDSFDSNCISPGTVFMENLHEEFHSFITGKISTDPLWQTCKIVFSGSKTPGEGEHKVLDYIRYLRTQSDYDPNTRHCFYGADADIIMLGLLTHEPNFVVLREKFNFVKLKKNPNFCLSDVEFDFIYLSILRDYLDLEFECLKDKLPFEYNLDSIIDDWVLMTFLLGNDFIPKLPDFYINTNAFPILYKVYKEVLPTLEGYLNNNGQLNLPGFREFLTKLSEHEMESFKEAFADFAYLEGKMNRNLIQNNELTEGEMIDEALAALAEPITESNTDLSTETTIETNVESVGIPTPESTVGKPVVKTSMKNDLENLIKSTNDILQISDEETCDKEDTLLLEFYQKKKNYYMERMGCEEVTEEFLTKQAETYVRAIQWNLYYYYLGCQSWNWFYANHYGPFISDIANFKDLTFDFEMGTPLPPLLQLLAVLPASSKDLLPKAFQHLVTSSDSPIIDFYPEDFETYLQAQQQLWEAVPLIKFVDRDRLLEAATPYEDQLTKEENIRNTCQPMQIYSYTPKNLGVHKKSKYFPSITANHAQVEDVLLQDISVDKSKLKFGCLKTGSNILSSTFPSLKYIPHTGTLKHCKVMTLSYRSKDETVLITITKKEFPSLEILADNLLGKIIYVNWPFMNKASVVAVADLEKRFNLVNNQKTEKPLPDEIKANQHKIFQSLQDEYSRKKGIQLGKIEVVVMVKLLEGRNYLVNSNGKLTNEEIWSSNITTWPLQVVVTDLVDHSEGQESKTLEDAFQVGSTVFMLSKFHFGAMGKILDSSDTIIKNGRLKVALELTNDFSVTDSVRSTKVVPYMSSKRAGQKIGISGQLFSRITGFILIHETSDEENSDKSHFKVNIGLAMKLNSQNKELPGFTKKHNDFWLYSARAANIVAKYIETFPQVAQHLSTNINNDFYKKEELFPGPEGSAEIQKIIDWIQQQEYQNVEFVQCGSIMLEPEVIEDLEKTMSSFQKITKITTIEVKPNMLFKNDLVVGKSTLVQNTQNFLLDRVVSIKSCPVPVGLRGVIVGILKGATEDKNVYQIFFDEPFLGGEKIHKYDYQGYKMSATDFLNITNASRSEQTATLVSVPQISEKPTNLETKPNPSAFVRWRQSSTDKNPNSQFQKIWSSLKGEQPEEEAVALKKLLKISDEPKATIENPVKIFFEKMKASSFQETPAASVSSVPVENCNVIEANVSKVLPMNHKGKPNSHFEKICAYCRERNLMLPELHHGSIGNKVVATLIFDNGKIYSGFPSESKELATENVAKKAFAALTGFVQSGREHHQSPKSNNKVILNQMKLTKALNKAQFEAPPANKEPRSQREKPKFQPKNREYYDSNHGPRSLPYPPEKWVVRNPRPQYFYNHQNSWRVERKNVKEDHGHNVSDAQTKSGESHSNKSNLMKFVPLQAIVGKRSFKPIATTRSDTSLRPDKPTELVKKPETKNSASGRESTRKGGRRPNKIAANLNFDMNL